MNRCAVRWRPHGTQRHHPCPNRAVDDVELPDRPEPVSACEQHGHELRCIARHAPHLLDQVRTAGRKKQ